MFELIKNIGIKNILFLINNDGKIFLEGIAYAVLGKGLDKISDFEEAILHKDFQSNYNKLLSLVDLHKIKNTHKKDAVFGVKIFNESGDDIERKIVVQSKDKGEVKKMFDKIVYESLHFIMKYAGQLNSWAWRKHTKMLRTKQQIENEEYVKELKKKL